MTESCPFCAPDSERIFHAGKLVLGIWDAAPVSAGHALLITKRHAKTWFDASGQEQAELSASIEVARSAIEAAHSPDGYNIGINIGAASGQTVGHLHVHVIPRYAGDVDDPTGGVRGVIPDKARYTLPSHAAETIGDREPKPFLRTSTSSAKLSEATPHQRAIVTGDDDPFAPHLISHLAHARHADFAIAFALDSGVRLLEPHLDDLLSREGTSLRLVTGDYMDATDPAALRRLHDLQERYPDRASIRVFCVGAGASFHPKSYMFRFGDGEAVAYVGSSNLSRTALGKGIEWNYRVLTSRDAAGCKDVGDAFERLWSAPAVVSLTSSWIDGYAERRQVRALPVTAEFPEETEIPEPPPSPHRFQSEALGALAGARQGGAKAGLVVLGTGLGKTWLSAFDTDRPAFKRVLFVAHREEILTQAMRTYRRIRPGAHLGLYNGSEREPDAEVLFASIQTLSRQRHLEMFARDAFDYIVVDEFHHAAAATYRRLIDYFTPRFLLGLTATPERTDGADLLELCGGHLIYRRDFPDGIREKLLCPFAYFGVPDEVEYENIPWRSSKFDDEALTNALATNERAENVFDQMNRHAGTRTLAFCCSRRHADFMRSFFASKGLRAAAIYSGEGSDARTQSMEALGAGDLDVVCAVDMFNEGVDLPEVDRVVMLRPTESRILFLQQFGRGLRQVAGKTLTVIDYIGNHRSFLLKPQALLGLDDGDRHLVEALQRLDAGTFDLPEGCSVTYELEAKNFLAALCRDRGDALEQFYRDFLDRTGVRPTAVETYRAGFGPASVATAYGSWHGFVARMGGLTSGEAAAVEDPTVGAFLRQLATTRMVRSYKMLTLLALLEESGFPGAITVGDLVARVQQRAGRSAAVRSDLSCNPESTTALRRLLLAQPLPAWTGSEGTGGRPYFKLHGDEFATDVAIDDELGEAATELIRELAEWRLAAYLDQRANPEGFLCSVGFDQGKATLILPDRSSQGGIPLGPTPVLVADRELSAEFSQSAVGSIAQPPSDENLLPAILVDWFGPDPAAAKNRFKVRVTAADEHFILEPAGEAAPAKLERWRHYTRAEIPAAFGFAFDRNFQSTGYIAKPGHLFLFVTLDKSQAVETQRYADRFLSADEFQWESQNRTIQGGKDGERISKHQELGIEVHLFVRARAKERGKTLPFYYCGELDYLRWESEKPIRVWWRLRETVPLELRKQLNIE